MFYLRTFAIAVLLLCSPYSRCDETDTPMAGSAPPPGLAELEKKFHFKTGTIAIGDNLATVTLTEDFHYLDSAQTKTVLEELWGNPQGDGTLGMIVPAKSSLLDSSSWAVIITYQDDGYVKDDDAEKIDYEKLLKEMQKSTQEGSEARVKEGYESIELVGWASPPKYDRERHKLYWAKELKFGGSPDHILNYNIRALGRKGVLVLNVVGSMDQLPAIDAASPQILSMVEFNPGMRYSDYDPGTDKLAEYGIAALIGGGMAAAATKGGLFKGLFAILLAAKKFVVVLVFALWAGIAKFFDRKKKAAAVATEPPSATT